jgi:DNA-binding NarL/FixJ family response regulator
MNGGKIRLFLVDDHQIVLDGLKALLEHDDAFEIVGTTTQSSRVVSYLQQSAADVLLTDVMMPDLSGPQLAKEVRRQFPKIKILALSMSGQGHMVNQMIDDSDINGYVLKNISREELSAAIRKIAAGGIYFSDEVLAEMETASKSTRHTEEVNLTPREIEIIRLIEKEMGNKEIAETLFISERTVETHRKNIFRKTGTNSLIGLIKYAYEHRLV